MSHNIQKPFLSIVIPFHDEEESLRRLLPELLENVQQLACTVEIILVDDASQDKSVEVVQSLQTTVPEIKLLQLPKQGGQTGCFKAAFQQAQGEYILRMDADLQDDPQDLPKFLGKIEQNAELVMGLRECRKHPKALRFASGVYDLILLLLFDSPLHAHSGSYVAFKAELVKNIPFKKNDHRYLPLIAIRRGAKNISEVIVRHRERQWGVSKYKPFKKLLLGIPEVMRFLLRLKSGVYDITKEERMNGGHV